MKPIITLLLNPHSLEMKHTYLDIFTVHNSSYIKIHICTYIYLDKLLPPLPLLPLHHHCSRYCLPAHICIFICIFIYIHINPYHNTYLEELLPPPPMLPLLSPGPYRLVRSASRS